MKKKKGGKLKPLFKFFLCDNDFDNRFTNLQFSLQKVFYSKLRVSPKLRVLPDAFSLRGFSHLKSSGFS